MTETDDEGYPHLITDIAGTCSSKTDYESWAEIQERLKQRHCLPQKLYADSGFMTGPNAQIGIDLIGPTVPVVSKQSKILNGITTDQFDTECGHLVTPATENAIYKRCFLDPLQISKELPGG